MNAVTMNVDLTLWPAAALQVSVGGDVQASNGRLEALLGEDVVGKNVLSLLDDGPSADKWRRLLESGQSAATTEMIFRARGVYLEPRAFSLIRDDGEIHLVEHPTHPRLAQLAAQVEETNTDLATTQRELVIERGRLAAALKELERSNQALDEFAHAVSHDLKAPLRAMKDCGEILAGANVDPAERDLHAQRIVDLVGKMRRMIDGVFDYARAGRSRGNISEFDSRRAIEDLLVYLAPPRTIDVVVDEDLPTISGERVPFDQVFRNLLSNAFSYRRAEGARVRVSARRDGAFFEFIVADNGPGIPPAQQDRIWRLFQTSRPGEGTGIGLAVVKRLVEAQGGSISVSSAEGAGASFHVRWPVKAIRDRRGAERARAQ